MSYPFLKIERFWQDFWEKNNTYKTLNPSDPGFDPSKPKFYVLDMFPYPSGRGLHVGHPLGYIGSDIAARYKRSRGFNVLHPMGFDAFGLPAEQYAIETGTHPETTTKSNIENMRSQLKACALSYDWGRELSTTDSDYYRWTQWIFLKLFQSWFDPDKKQARPISTLIEKYKRDEFRVDPAKGRLAQNHPEFERARKWVDLSKADQEKALLWDRLAYMKEVSVNWCPGLGTVLANEEVTNDGRSERGNFPVFQRPLKQWILRITAYAERLIEDLSLLDWPEAIKQMQTHWIGKSEGAQILFQVDSHPSLSIEVFTTRPDTLFGCTFLALAPNHPWVDQITSPAQKSSVQEVHKKSGSNDDEEKRGAFTGAYAIHPITQKKVPIWIANYVMMEYGTGAIMAVPGHDQRDFEFAKKYHLPVLAVVTPSHEFLAANSIPLGSYLESPQELETAYENEGTSVHSNHPEISIDGLKTADAKEKIIQFIEKKGLGQRKVQYKLRDWLFSRQRYWGEPFPILHHPDGYPVAVDEKELPVTLPPLNDFRPKAQEDPAAEPAASLSRANKNWVHVQRDGVNYIRELNTMPQWAGSCWYYLRFIDPKNSKHLVDPQAQEYWMGKNGVDLYIGGVEHAVLHLLYARFWHKVLFDLGFVSTCEPFGKLFNQGYIQAYSYQDERGMYVDAFQVKEVSPGNFQYQGKPVLRQLGKMGKSLKNSIAPDDVIKTYGCDTFRLYEMYLGPLEQSKVWDTEAIIGVHRFLQRVWRNFVSENGDLLVGGGNASGKLQVLLHQTIKDVTELMEDMRFNTAIAKLIELNNTLVSEKSIPQDLAKAFVIMLAPFAPHICEELWLKMGEKSSVTHATWPKFDDSLLQKQEIEIVVQVNGKKRGSIFVSPNASQQDVHKAAQADENIGKYLELEVLKTIYVPGRLINYVVKTAS